jgi:uncharacterized protein (DUF58 family)
MMNEQWRKYFDPQTLASLSGLQLRARRLVEGYVAGVHRSPFAGHSIEFAQHREYVPGDDLRQVDWKVFGRTDKYYLKQFEAETNLICHLVLDASQSMAYRGVGSPWTKYAYAQCLIASLAYLVLDQQDAVSLSIFDRQLERHLPAAGNRGHWAAILEAIDRRPASGTTDLRLALQNTAERLSRRGIVILISDLFDDPAAIITGLEALRYRGHELAVIQVLDPDEEDFPFDVTTRFDGFEELPPIVVDPTGLRQAYRDEVEGHRREVQTACRRMGADFFVVRSDQPLHRVLPPWLARRSSARSTAGV